MSSKRDDKISSANFSISLTDAKLDECPVFPVELLTTWEPEAGLEVVDVVVVTNDEVPASSEADDEDDQKNQLLLLEEVAVWLAGVLPASISGDSSLT